MAQTQERTAFYPSDIGISYRGKSADSLPQGDYKTFCPKCSHKRTHKDPCLSLSVRYNDDWVVNCHNCGWAHGKGGERQKSRFEYNKPSFVPTEPSSPLIQWFANRGISEDVVKKNRISVTLAYIPAKQEKVPCIAFPATRDGEIINVKYRSLESKDFAQEKGAEKIFFGLDNIKGNDTAIIVEGEVDMLSYQEAGVDNVMSVPDGAPEKPLKDDSKKLEYLANCENELRDIKRFYIATDSDEPGDVLAQELARRLGKERCWRVKLPEGCKDANEVLQKLGKEALKDTLLFAEPYPIEGVYHATDYRSTVLERYEKGRGRGLTTGWDNIDRNFTLVTGRLYIVSGYPSSGKSEFCDALAVNAVHNHGWNVAFWSAENEPEEHLPKLIEKHLGVPFWEGPSPRMSKEDVENGLAWANQHFSFIRNERIDAEPTATWIIDRAKQAVLRDGIKMLIVDPYNLMSKTGEKLDKETDFILGILQKLKKFAIAHDVMVVFIAHPGKPEPGAGMKPPNPYSLSGSAHWFNVADILFVVHRDRAVKSPIVEILTHKVRFKWIGVAGSAHLEFDLATGTYQDTGLDNQEDESYSTPSRKRGPDNSVWLDQNQ